MALWKLVRVEEVDDGRRRWVEVDCVEVAETLEEVVKRLVGEGCVVELDSGEGWTIEASPKRTRKVTLRCKA